MIKYTEQHFKIPNHEKCHRYKLMLQEQCQFKFNEPTELVPRVNLNSEVSQERSLGQRLTNNDLGHRRYGLWECHICSETMGKGERNH